MEPLDEDPSPRLMAREESEAEKRRHFWIGIARAFGGAIFFSIPLLMTMEMWWLGFYLDRTRLAIFAVAMIPMLIGLSHYSGFKETASWLDDVADGLVAYGVGIVATGAVLFLLNIVRLDMPPREIFGKILLQAIAAAFGAVLANSQLSQRQHERRQAKQDRAEETSYGAELFLMSAGAVFLAFNVAPTEEMILIAVKLTTWHAIALAVVSLLAMHGFVYSVNFRGTHPVPESTAWWSVFLRYTVVGYALSLALSAYVLWTFGRFDDHSSVAMVVETLVLAFPASLGAAAARLIF